MPAVAHDEQVVAPARFLAERDVGSPREDQPRLVAIGLDEGADPALIVLLHPRGEGSARGPQEVAPLLVHRRPQVGARPDVGDRQGGAGAPRQ